MLNLPAEIKTISFSNPAKTSERTGLTFSSLLIVGGGGGSLTFSFVGISSSGLLIFDSKKGGATIVLLVNFIASELFPLEFLSTLAIAPLFF